MTNSLTKEEKEILNDSFWLTYISKIINNVDNLWVKHYITNFVLFFSTIYVNELINANYGKINPEINLTEKELKNLRVENIKQLPKESNKKIEDKIKDMGLDFNKYLFDMTILCDQEKTLYDINFRMWNLTIRNKENYGKLESIINTSLSLMEEFLYDYYEGIFKIAEKHSDIYIKNIQKYRFKAYSYSSHKFFKTNIIPDEKIYILQRYGLIKSIMWFEKIFERKMNIKIGELQFDLEKFIMKIKAIVIETIGHDRKSCNYTILNRLLEINEKTIDNNFFKINRKIRNNIHYNRIQKIEEEELKIAKQYQDVYFENLIKIFDDNIDISIGLKNKFDLFLAKLKYWCENKI